MLITMIDAGKVRKNSRGFINIDFRGEMRKTVSGGKEMCKTGRHKTPFPWRKPNRTTQLQIDCSDEMEFSEKFMACHQDDLTQSLRVVKEVAKLFKYNTPKPPVRSQLKINKIEHEGHRDSLQASQLSLGQYCQNEQNQPEAVKERRQVNSTDRRCSTLDMAFLNTKKQIMIFKSVVKTSGSLQRPTSKDDSSIPPSHKQERQSTPTINPYTNKSYLYFQHLANPIEQLRKKKQYPPINRLMGLKVCQASLFLRPQRTSEQLHRERFRRRCYSRQQPRTSQRYVRQQCKIDEMAIKPWENSNELEQLTRNV